MQTVVHEAEIIHRNVQLLCVVLLKQDTDYVDALYVPDGYVPVTTIAEQAIMDTWGKRCRQLVFYSTGVPRVTLATGVQWVLLNDSIPGAEGQWRSCREALTHVAINYLHAYDWFFLAEEDTFVIIENLEYFLVAHDRTQLKYLGHAISKWNVDHNVIGAGVAINRNTLKKLHSELLKGHCAANDLSSDPALAQCLYGLGIYPEDTRDMLNRARFMLYPSQLLLVPASMVWRYRLWSNSKYSSSEVLMHNFSLMLMFKTDLDLVRKKTFVYT